MPRKGPHAPSPLLDFCLAVWEVRKQKVSAAGCRGATVEIAFLPNEPSQGFNFNELIFGWKLNARSPFVSIAYRESTYLLSLQWDEQILGFALPIHKPCVACLTLIPLTEPAYHGSQPTQFPYPFVVRAAPVVSDTDQRFCWAS